MEIQNNVSIFPNNEEDSALHLSTFHVNCLAKFTEKVGTCQLPVDLDTCMLCDVLNFVFLFFFFFFYTECARNFPDPYKRNRKSWSRWKCRQKGGLYNIMTCMHIILCQQGDCQIYFVIQLSSFHSLYSLETLLCYIISLDSHICYYHRTRFWFSLDSTSDLWILSNFSKDVFLIYDLSECTGIHLWPPWTPIVSRTFLYL